jgi:hypothetical protein
MGTPHAEKVELVCPRCGDIRLVTSHYVKTRAEKVNPYCEYCRKIIALGESIPETPIFKGCTPKPAPLGKRCKRFLSCTNYLRCLDYAAALNWDGWIDSDVQ